MENCTDTVFPFKGCIVIKNKTKGNISVISHCVPCWGNAQNQERALAFSASFIEQVRTFYI